MGHDRMMTSQSYLLILFLFWFESAFFAQVYQMKNSHTIQYIEQESWLEFIGEQINKNFIAPRQELIYLQDPIFLDGINSPQTSISQNIKKSLQKQLQKTSKQQQYSVGNEYIEPMEIQSDKEQNYRENFTNQIVNQEQLSNQQSEENQKQRRQVKWRQYAKTYRQRKKGLHKTLQQQNVYLKKKINELQMRLSQKQLEINRLKYAPQQEFSLEQLKQDFLIKTNINDTLDPANQKARSSAEEKFYTEFMNSYDTHGFGGTRKKNLLNYYFNELLLSIMRDSEKYLFLVCNTYEKPQELRGLQSFEQIDVVFMEIMKIDSEQQNERVMNLANKLHPFMREIKTICSDMMSNFNKIGSIIDKVHNIMKSTYAQNKDFGRKRIEISNWFEHNKHSKLIRRLRSQWLESIKKSSLGQTEQKSNYKNKKKIKTTETIKVNS